MSNPFQWEKFNRLPVVGILRGFPLNLVMEIGKNCAAGGLAALEVTMNTPGADEQIAGLVEECGAQMNIGAGTVTNMAELEQALGSGANFIVTPITLPDIVRTCKAEGVLVFPGAYTPTEIYACHEAGADMVKVFPANQLGPGYIKAVKGPLNNIKLLATGGVGLENGAEYIAAGADGFGVGSPLFQKERMEASDWQWLKDQIAGFQQLFAE